ncbi:E3 ubiquitin-protein ligase RNF8-like [Rana temporaria]|uniref:E3 ubiquitin-protein ligase RNF8-like n=1 Tax=Rana temporaria TaxID=8407 RepID=UPI001AAD4423|nr:E3 ubiquitin-protein ligase RNF8-like [Rana temporaria]
MERTVRDVLLKALDNLTEQSFQRFRSKLPDCKIEEGFRNIRRGSLEKADRDDVVDLILRNYANSYGPELTADVLESIDEGRVASDLQKDLENEVFPKVRRTRPLRRPVQRAEDEGAAPSNMTNALTCCVCMELYTDPVSLPCGHSYCMGCITRTWQNQHPRVASCPLCARTYPNRPELNKNWGLCELVEVYRAQPGQHS